MPVAKMSLAKKRKIAEEHNIFEAVAKSVGKFHHFRLAIAQINNKLPESDRLEDENVATLAKSFTHLFNAALLKQQSIAATDEAMQLLENEIR